MALPWLGLTVILGFLYGALKRGKQAKGPLIKQGIMIGLVVALILLVLDWLTQSEPLGLRTGLLVVVNFMLAGLVYAVLFVLGVWLGDLVTGAKARAR